MQTADVSERYIPAIDENSLEEILSENTDALIAMLPNDEDNYRACEIAFAKYGVQRLIVRPKDMASALKFSELGALIADAGSTMVNLLSQSVRAPQSTSILLQQDSGREIMQITVNNPDLDGLLVRDLRLPDDVLFLEVTRNGQAIVPGGYTPLKLKDEVTLLGQPNSLSAVTLKMGY